MPRTDNRKLTLTRLPGDQVQVEFSYDLIFHEFERHMAAGGLVFIEKTYLFGVDPPNSTTGSEIFHVFSINAGILVPDGPGPITIHRTYPKPIFSRAYLDEDKSGGPIVLPPDTDTDEFRVKIQITTSPPLNFTAFSNQAELGLVVHPTINAEVQASEN